MADILPQGGKGTVTNIFLNVYQNKSALCVVCSCVISVNSKNHSDQLRDETSLPTVEHSQRFISTNNNSHHMTRMRGYHHFTQVTKALSVHASIVSKCQGGPMSNTQLPKKKGM